MNSGMPSGHETDVISLLTTIPFKLNSPDSRLAILQKGRPRVIVKNIAEKVQHLHGLTTWYEIYPWLCGSAQCNKLFCWPCLLMRPETSSWCSTGTDDFKKFIALATKHNTSKAHLKAISEYDATLLEAGLPLEFDRRPRDFEMDFKCERFDSEAGQMDKGGFQPVKTIETAPSASKEKSGAAPTRQTLTYQAWQSAMKEKQTDSKLARRKRKLARLEIANAQLTSKKLNLEISLLEKKVELQTLLIQQMAAKTGS